MCDIYTVFINALAVLLARLVVLLGFIIIVISQVFNPTHNHENRRDTVCVCVHGKCCAVYTMIMTLCDSTLVTEPRL